MQEQEHEAKYRQYLQSTPSLIVAFFERPDEFPRALEDVRNQLEKSNAVADKSCLLYRTKCEMSDSPRWRVWTQLVPFDALTFPDEPLTPWVGLDRQLNRPMTDQECQTFLTEKRYEVFEIRVSRRPREELVVGARERQSAPPPPLPLDDNPIV